MISPSCGEERMWIASPAVTISPSWGEERMWIVTLWLVQMHYIIAVLKFKINYLPFLIYRICIFCKFILFPPLCH